MPVSWTPEQVLGLAPDEASRKNASGLAHPRKWLRLDKNDPADPSVLWGEMQGSGADPYRCQVDLTGPDFKCSCPSHKRPCKHALGLFLLYAGQPGAFEVSQPPDWVAAWLAKRAELSSRAAAAAGGKTIGGGPEADDAAAGAAEAAKAVEEKRREAQNRRAAGRDKKIRAGLDDLETWLQDLLRQGIASAQAQPRAFWETTASRLVDAQAPGLARLVREMPGVTASGEGWQERLLEKSAQLYLAIEGYRRMDSLPAETQADLRTVIGFTLKQEDLLASAEASVSDTWLVLGREISEETGLKTQRIWLRGQSTGRPALILSFAIGGSMLDASLAPGMALPAELVFYPSAYPLRAAIRTRQPAQPLPAQIPGCDSLVAATAGYASALARHPWLERYPLILNQVHPVNEDGEWALYDAEMRRVLLAKAFQHGWTLLALSGGQPLGIFGEWNGERLLPLSAWAEGQFIELPARLA